MYCPTYIGNCRILWIVFLEFGYQDDFGNDCRPIHGELYIILKALSNTPK